MLGLVAGEAIVRTDSGGDGLGHRTVGGMICRLNGVHAIRVGHARQGLFGVPANRMAARRTTRDLGGEQSPWKDRLQGAGNGGLQYGFVSGEMP